MGRLTVYIALSKNQFLIVVQVGTFVILDATDSLQPVAAASTDLFPSSASR
jgi:hypothetical protein